MKIFQLIHWLTKLFKLNNRSKIILLILLPLPIFSQNNAFWLGKRTAVSDPYFSNVSLLLHMDGANGSTTFTDDSNNNFTITANGNAQISTTQSKFGGASGKFDGSGDNLLLPSLNFSQSNFTIEFFLFLNLNSSQSTIFDSRPLLVNNVSIYFGLNDDLKLQFIVDGVYSLVSSTAIIENQFNHIAFVRNGNNFTFYINGISSGTSTNSYNFIKINNNSSIGSTVNNTFYLNGFLDEFRITIGVARYTANFTPPTAPFPNN